MTNLASAARAPIGKLLLCSLVLCGLAACGSDAGGVRANFPAAPQQMIVSDHGVLHIAVRTAPDPPIRGDNRVRLDVTDAAGMPIDGLDLTMQPWMPAHSHGTSVTPAVAPQSGGVYEVDNVYLYMAGTWQLRLSFSGTETDTATPVFDIP